MPSQTMKAQLLSRMAPIESHPNVCRASLGTAYASILGG